MSLIKYVLCGFLLCIVTLPAYANLLITPLHAVIEDRERSAQITLINSGNEARVYHLEWSQLRQNLEYGRYESSPARQEGEIYLQDFAVFSPRRIRLGPNEKQTVRIGIRRPSDLPDGEYKSHLKFRAVIEGSDVFLNRPEQEEGDLNVQAYVLTSYQIPIIYRVGEGSLDVSIESPLFSTNSKTGNLEITIPLRWSATQGAIGTLEVYHQPTGREKEQIGILGNINVFPEGRQRDVILNLEKTGLEPGELSVVYKRTEEDKEGQEILAQGVFPVRN